LKHDRIKDRDFIKGGLPKREKLGYDGQTEGETTALADNTFRPDTPLVGIDNMLTNR